VPTSALTKRGGDSYDAVFPWDFAGVAQEMALAVGLARQEHIASEEGDCRRRMSKNRKN
jgi:hypothetical protein